MTQSVVVLTPEQVEQLVDRVVAKRLEQLPQSGAREVFDLTQAAEFLGRHPKVVSKLIRDEGLPAHYISDREPRFFRSELAEWLRSRPTKPAEDPNGSGSA